MLSCCRRLQTCLRQCLQFLNWKFNPLGYFTVPLCLSATIKYILCLILLYSPPASAAFPSSCVNWVARTLGALLTLLCLLGKFEFWRELSFLHCLHSNSSLHPWGGAFPSSCWAGLLLFLLLSFGVYVRHAIFFVFDLCKVYLCFSLYNFIFVPFGCLVQLWLCFLLFLPFSTCRLCLTILLRPT